MKLRIEIELENEILQGAGCNKEIRRILEEVVENLIAGYPEGSLRDLNGNRAGFFRKMRGKAKW